MTSCPYCGRPGAPFEHIDCFVKMEREMATDAFGRALEGAMREDIASGNVWPEDDE